MPRRSGRSTVAGVSDMERKRSLDERLDAIRERISDADFLANKGLGNEVGIHVFTYPPEQEMRVRAAVSGLVEASDAGRLPCRIRERNLWHALLQVCDERGISDKIDALEARRGSDSLLKRMQKIATPEALLASMDWQPHEPGRDVLFITGVGEVYPFARAHAILDNGQHVFSDVPVVLFYPGTYNGRELSLFGRRDESANYYRAFNLI